MGRLTDRKTAADLKSNYEGLRAKGIEPNISDLRYIKLAEYENAEDHLNRACANCNYANYAYEPVEGQIFCCHFNSHYRYDDYCYKFQKKEGDL